MHEEDVVPRYELWEAAVYAHMSIERFEELDGRVKARIVAHKRISALIEQHYHADASLGM
jgi:hypothetical protein